MKKKKKKKKKNYFKKNFFVDSRDRNQNIYKHSYKFQLKLDEPIRNVKAIVIKNINIDLNNRYLINEYNNIFEIEYINKTGNTSIKKFILEKGDYEIGNFYTDAIRNGNIIDGKYTYDIKNLLGFTIVELINDFMKINENTFNQIEYEINDIDNKFVFTSFLNKKIRFPSNNGDSLAHILGFIPDILYDGKNANIISNYPIKFKKEQYGLLYINNYNNKYSNKNSIINSFYIIHNKDNNNLLCSLNNNIKYFNPYEEYIDKLNIKLLDYYGNYINLNNNNFSFELIFYYYN